MKVNANSLGNILLVEDEENLHEALKLNLEMEGYSVTSAFDGNKALSNLENEYFDLIIMDIMLPELDGISVIERARILNIDTPILILSAKSTIPDKIIGLKKGADDYLTKPFDLEELMLRVDKLIRKNKQLQMRETVSETYTFGNNHISFSAQEATTWDNKKLNLSKKESMLLKLLIENKNEVVTREKILQVVWGYNVYPNTRTIDNFILNFRKYFERNSRSPRHFHSVRGVGYKFTE